MGYTYLTKPGRIGNLETKNRMIMPPMATCLADPEGGGSVSDRLIDYYAVRAKGGVGLIVVENTLCTPTEKYGTQLAVHLNIGHRRSLPGWARLTDAVHEWGAKIAVQINFPGGGIDPSIERDVQAVTASPVALAGFIRPIITREATIEDIQYIVDQFAVGAEIAKDAGFDAIELHCVHGYGIAGFQSRYQNQRKDLYGGTFENRMRLGLEIISRVKECVGNDYPVWCRIPVDEFLPPLGVDREEGVKIAQTYAAGGVDAVHLSCGGVGTIDRTVQPKYYPRCYLESYCEAIKTAIDVPIMVAGSFNNPEDAERLLREGKADFACIGRGVIADPEYPKKITEGRIDDIRKCIRCVEGCISTIIVKSHGVNCAVNFEAGNEARRRITPALEAKKVLVIGGGPGGMEAARVAALRGHEVTLCEKNSRLGGNLLLASIPSFNEELRWLIEWFSTQIQKLGIKVELDKEVSETEVLEMNPDAVVIATGSAPLIPTDISGVEKAVTADDVLTEKVEAGQEVIIVGGNLIGCETALHLAQNGKNVTVLEMLDQIAQDAEIMINRKALLPKLSDNNVKWGTETKVVEIGDNQIRCLVSPWERKNFSADTVVLAAGRKSLNELVAALKGNVPEVYAIGDCVQPRKIMHAIHEGSLCARKI